MKHEKHLALASSALLEGLRRAQSAAGETLEEIRAGRLSVILTDAVLADYEHALDNLEEDEKLSVLAMLGVGAQTIRPKPGSKPKRSKGDQGDLPYLAEAMFYDAAISMQRRKRFADVFLVTTNKELYPPRPFLVTPDELLDTLDFIRRYDLDAA